MKKLFFLALLVLMLFASGAHAQQLKFGHINTNELLAVMPGRDSAQVQLQNHARTLEETFAEMQTELQTKFQEYVANEATYSELIRQSRQRELNNLQERVQEFQELAQQDLAQMEQRLLAPIIQAARQAIEDVAKELGYTYVFDTATGAVIFFPPGDNLIQPVKTRLGIIN
ncbi:MAG TPA: OmpH family outer membrane protein [Bacteroidales bacterium]|nr:OmpH family outer membrane protein [Bacteroidales bacterium]